MRSLSGFLPTFQYNNPYKSSLEDIIPLSKSTGKVVLLYKYFEAMLGRPIIPRDQGLGSDCVGQATAAAIDILQAVQIAGLGLPYQWIAPACASSIYGGSRVEIGKQVYKARFSGDGSHVPYAAEFVKEYGALYMRKYEGLDLTKHSWTRSKAWGNNGIPDEFEPEAKLHGIKDFKPVLNWPEIRTSIENGYPVVVGSSQGFAKQRERKDGFLRPNGKWMHATVLIGSDDGDRPGALDLNSWGADWVGGAKLHDQPDGSFWIDADVVEDMVRKGEAISLAGHEGFEIRTLEYNLL